MSSPAAGDHQPHERSFAQGSSQTVNWSMNGAVSVGSFRLWLKNTSTNAWVVSPPPTSIAAVENQRSYSVPWPVSQPAGTYRLWVYYYAADGSTVLASAAPSGTISIAVKSKPAILSHNSGLCAGQLAHGELERAQPGH